LHPAELRVDVGVQPPELRADVVCDGGPQVTNAERPACENAEQRTQGEDEQDRSSR